MVEISVVVPVYGCRECLLALHERLTKTLATLTTSYEILFVDDRSPDESWPVLAELAKSDPNVRAIRLSRNFGQHAAITAGLRAGRGRYTVVMDCDLQDSPEEIPRFYSKIKNGYDLILGRRVERRDSGFRRFAAHTYFRLLNLFAGTKLAGEFGTFSMLSAKVREAYLELGEQDRHSLFILNWLGFEPAELAALLTGEGFLRVTHEVPTQGGSPFRVFLMTGVNE